MSTHRIASLFILLAATLFGSGCIVETESDSIASSESYATATNAPGWFELFEGNDGQWYFRLKSSNHQIVLRSEGYTQKAGAANGIASVETNGIDLKNFQIKQASNGEWYFNVRAQNYQVIGQSELYVSKYNAERGAKNVRDLLARMLRHDAALNGGAGFELFVGNDGEFYWHLEAANHEIVLQSEGYVTEAGARNGIESVRNNGKSLDNYEILQAQNGQWYFNLKAQNHEVIGQSELYVSKYNAERGAETVADLLYSERVADAE
jgi:hypothetical protein